jgi:predicted DNA-binding transcriptional regulator AlpA
MPAKDEVKAALTGFITRVSSGKADSDRELEIFPEVVRAYLDHYGRGVDRSGGISQTTEDAERDAEEQAISIPFPYDGFVTAASAAAFLGLSDLKNPESKIRRLANEGEIPPPIRKGNRAFRYSAEGIRAYKKRLETDRACERGGSAA